MNEERKTRAYFISHGITLNSLKDRQRFLNACLLLAMQLHDTDEEERIRQELNTLQEDIDCMISNGRFV